MNDIFAIVLGYYLQRHGLEERLTYDNYLLSVKEHKKMSNLPKASNGKPRSKKKAVTKSGSR